MKMHYYPETDSLYIDLAERPSVDSRQIAEGVVLDFDEHGQIVGIDIDHASKVVALDKFESVALPATSVSLRTA